MAWSRFPSSSEFGRYGKLLEGMTLQPKKPVGDSLAMGSQPFRDESGIEIVTQVFDDRRVSRHDVVDGMSGEEFAFLIDPKLGPFGDVFAKDLRAQYVVQRRSLMERIPRLSSNTCSLDQPGTNSGLRKIISEFSEFIFRNQSSIEIVWNQH